MKPSVVKVDTYIDWCVPHNKRYSKFRFGAIWEYQNPKIFFAKGYMQNWSGEVFAINKVKNIIPWTLLSVILAMKWLLKHYMKKNCKRQAKDNPGLKT